MCQTLKLILTLSFMFLNLENFTLYSSKSDAIAAVEASPQNQNFDKNGFKEKYAEEIETPCAEFRIVRHLDYAADVTDFLIPTERQIAELRHVNGIKPIHYNWTMNFSNSANSNFISRITIIIEVMWSVEHLILDIDPKSLSFVDKTKIFLKNLANNEKICFKSVVFIDEDRNMFVKLNEKLKPGIYVINMGTFEGSPLSRKNESWGLQVGGEKSSNMALTTIFQMRGARTVFPCFDHPSLKATFRVCVEHSNDTLASSNMEVESVEFLKNNRILECYEKTRKIPVYVLTLALLRNFSNATDNTSVPKLDLYYADNVGLKKFVYEFNDTRRVIALMEYKTQFPFPLKKLGLLNVNNAPFWRVENFGLVTLESGFTQDSEYERDHTIIVHEIIHQWLGNVVTISDWSEICLQEGLTALIEWTISFKLNYSQHSVAELALEARAASLYKSHTSPVIQQYNVTKDIADYCFGKPAVILHSISYFYSGIWDKFLSKLLEKYPYSNANLTDWINVLNEVSDGKAGKILKSWYTEIGYPVFYAEISKRNQLTINQYVFLNDNGDPQIPPYIPSKAIITPLRVYTKNGLTPINNSIMIESTRHNYTLKNVSEADWFILDPSCVTLSRNIYPVKNYLSLIDYYNDVKNNHLNVSHMNVILTDFCFALTNDWLPLVPYSGKFDASSWEKLFSKIFDLVKNSKHPFRIRMNEICQICIRKEEDFQTKEPRPHINASVSSIWNEDCSRLKLIKLMGRSYTIPNDSSTNNPMCGQSTIQPIIQPVISGQDNDRILDGEVARAHSWPWQVSLKIFKNGHLKHICGGTIIATNKILCAAHCLIKFGMKQINYVIVAGLHDQYADEDTARSFHIKNFSLPEGFDFNNNLIPDDIMVITLIEELIYNEFMTPICLSNRAIVGSTCYVTGWGKNESASSDVTSAVLRQVDMPIQDASLCKDRNIHGKIFNDTKMLCAGHNEGGKDSCYGDSGGPLICKESNNWYQVGIVSTGSGCGQKDKPGIYTLVSFYYDWLQKQLHNNAN